MDVIYEYYLVDQNNLVQHHLAPGQGGEEMCARQEELERAYGDLRVAPEAFRHLLVRHALPAYVSLPDLLLGPHSAPLPAPMGNVGNAIAAAIAPVVPVAPFVPAATVAPVAAPPGPVAVLPAPVVAPRAVPSQENPTPAAATKSTWKQCKDVNGATGGERNDKRVREGRARRGRPLGSKTKRTEPYPTNGGSGTQKSPVRV